MSNVLSKLPSSYGPLITNKDYELLVESDTYYEDFIVLDGHSLGAPDVDQADPVSIPYTIRRRGRPIQLLKFVKPALVRNRSYEIIFPHTLWTPLTRIAERSSQSCLRNVFMRYLCSEEECYRHAFRYPDAMFDPPVEQDAPIAVDDDEGSFNIASTMHTAERLVYYYLRGLESYDQTGATPVPNFNAVAYANGNCETCNAASENKYGYLVGDDGDSPTVPIFYRTRDGFSFSNSWTNQSANLPGTATSITLRDIYADGDFVIIVGNAAADSEVFVSTDGGDTIGFARIASTGATVFTGIIFNTVGRGGGYYWLAGEDGDVYRSRDGFLWEAFTLPTALAAFDLNDITGDGNYTYMVGATSGGNAAVVRIEGDIAMDISATVFGTPPAQEMFVVARLEDSHIAVAGNNGILYESVNAGKVGEAWQVSSISGSTSNIRFVGGDSYRVIVANAASQVWERSVLTDKRWKEVPNVAGFTVSGAYLAGATGINEFGSNDFVLITDAEVILLKSCLPDA